MVAMEARRPALRRMFVSASSTMYRRRSMIPCSANARVSRLLTTHYFPGCSKSPDARRSVNGRVRRTTLRRNECPSANDADGPFQRPVTRDPRRRASFEEDRPAAHIPRQVGVCVATTTVVPWY